MFYIFQYLTILLDHTQFHISRFPLHRQKQPTFSIEKNPGGDGAEPMDLHAQLKRMTCRTEFFRPGFDSSIQVLLHFFLSDQNMKFLDQNVNPKMK